MIPELTPEQTQSFHAAGDKPMPVVDPVTKHVYLVIDPSKPEEAIEALRQNQDLASIQRGIADLEAGRHSSSDEVFDRIRAKHAAKYGE